MGTYKVCTAKTEVHVLILGLDASGKTTLLEQMKAIFKRGVKAIPADRIRPTVGLNIGKMPVKDCTVTFWDLGGQTRVRSIWDKYYSEAHGLVFVLDSADVGRFEEARLAFDAVRDHADLDGVPFLLLANKQDLPGALTSEDIAVTLGIDAEAEVLGDGAQEYALRGHAFRLQPASALTQAGIADGVSWLVEQARPLARWRAAGARR